MPSTGREPSEGGGACAGTGTGRGRVAQDDAW